MNKLSFFVFLLSFLTQISLAEPTKITPYKHYPHVPMLNDKMSQRCSTVEPAWFYRGELECACDDIEEILNTAATTPFLLNRRATADKKKEENAIQIILSDESIENKSEAYNNLQNVKTKLCNARIEALKAKKEPRRKRTHKKLEKDIKTLDEKMEALEKIFPEL